MPRRTVKLPRPPPGSDPYLARLVQSIERALNDMQSVTGFSGSESKVAKFEGTDKFTDIVDGVEKSILSVETPGGGVVMVTGKVDLDDNGANAFLIVRLRKGSPKGPILDQGKVSHKGTVTLVGRDENPPGLVKIDTTRRRAASEYHLTIEGSSTSSSAEAHNASLIAESF